MKFTTFTSDKKLNSPSRRPFVLRAFQVIVLLMETLFSLVKKVPFTTNQFSQRVINVVWIPLGNQGRDFCLFNKFVCLSSVLVIRSPFLKVQVERYKRRSDS